MSNECIFMSDNSNIMTEVLLVDSTGSWIPTKEVDTSRDPISYSVGYFSNDNEYRGTGFIISVLDENNPHAFVLTSAHIFMNTEFEFLKEPLTFVVNGEPYEVTIVLKQINWDRPTSFPIDPISGNRISIPEDWLICEIRKFPNEYSTKLVPLKLSKATELSNGTKVKVYGYPKPISENMIGYCAPTSKLSEIDILNACIHGGKKLVLSEGEILSSSKELVCISSPTSNGMSGSPIIVDTQNGQEVIGILYGGPACFLHRKLNLAIKAYKNSNFLDEMKKLLKKMKKQMRHINNSGLEMNQDLYRMTWETKFVVKGLEEGRDFCRIICVDHLKTYYKGMSRIEAKIGNFLNYNIGILSQTFMENLEYFN